MGFFAALTFLAAVAGIPAPPQATLDTELTKVANERLAVETKAFIAELDRDPRPAQEKDEIRRKLAKVKIVVYTTPATVEGTVSHYADKFSGAAFLFAERNLLIDAEEIARSNGVTLDPTVQRTWHGKQGKSARWRRDDGSLEIDVEDHLIDPRTAHISKKTVVMITSTGD